MKINKKVVSRIIVSAFILVAVFSTIMGTLAYFMGFRGIGYGWPAFWANFPIAWMIFLVVAIIYGVGALLFWWITKAAKENN